MARMPMTRVTACGELHAQKLLELCLVNRTGEIDEVQAGSRDSLDAFSTFRSSTRTLTNTTVHRQVYKDGAAGI